MKNYSRDDDPSQRTSLSLSMGCAVLTLSAAIGFGCGDQNAGRGDPNAVAGATNGGASNAGAGGGAGAPVAGASGGVSVAGAGVGGMASAGSGGAVGGAGEGGRAGGGGAGGSGGSAGGQTVNPPLPSAGCSLPAGQALGAWVEQPKLSVNAKDRQWWVWLPAGYDPSHAYPVVFTFHGCGSPDNYVPLQKTAGNSAIIVRGAGITGGCWTYGATGDDVKFFDAMLANVFEKRCADTSRVFTSGYSSGSWLVNTLNCERGDKLRASASVSGGVAVDTSKCVKSEFGRFFIHDQNDPVNDFVKNGNQAELARLVKANHCSNLAPVPEDPAPCARYQGCDAGYPAVMCPTTNKGHDRRDDIAPAAFWKFFSSF